MSALSRTRIPAIAKSVALSLILAASFGAQAAITDLAPAPLVTSPTASVLPNVFLMMDDSGSMGWDYMPDNAGNFNNGTYGAASPQCNGIFYNPAITYSTPVTPIVLSQVTTVTGSPVITFASTATLPAAPAVGQKVTGIGIPNGATIVSLLGATQATLSLNATASNVGLTAAVSYPDSSFTNALSDGYVSTSTPVNLSTSFVDTGNDPAQAAFYYAYSGTQTTEKLKDYYNTASTFYKECSSNVGSAPGNAVFTKVLVPVAQQTNFANWYSYYRTRILMMKTATGLAFQPIGDTYRVGMATMNNNTTADFLALDQFTAAQKNAWYNKLYATKAGNSTPLREALSYVGLMYAHKLPATPLNNVNANLNNTVPDPIQFSCQQNFTILTTDGFWNQAATNNSCTNTSNCALSTTLSGTGTIGNQDGTEVRPMYDGTISAMTTTQILRTDKQTKLSTSRDDKWTQQLQTQTSTLQQRTGTLQWQTNQQQTSATLQWQSNLQQTASTLQWQTNLQKSTAPLQWQTNLQTNTAPLQWQTNLQKTTYTLAMWTDQMQVTAPLMWSTNMQATTGTLQIQTSQLQAQSNTLQGTKSKVLMTCANTPVTCGSAPTNGVANANWTVVTSGSCISAANKQCQIVTGLSGIVNVAMSCNTSGTITSSGTWSFTFTVVSPTSAKINNISIDGTNILTGTTASSSTASTVASNIVAKVGGGYTATSSGTTVTVTGPFTPSSVMSYTLSSGSVTLSGGPTGGSATVSNADSNGMVYSACSYTPGGWTNVTTCSTVSPSAASPFTVLTSTQCQYQPFTAWTNVPANGSCTTLAQSAGPAFTGPATNCQLTAPATGYISLATANGTGCTVTYNNLGTSTADASGKATSACTVAAYNVPANVGAGGVCDGTKPNLACSTGAPNPAAYVTNYPVPSCTVGFNALGLNTANASGLIVSACPTDGSFGPSAKLSPATPVGANNTCDWSAPHVGNMHMWCDIDTTTAATAFVTSYTPTCATSAATFTSPYFYVTADANGKYISACPVSLTYSTPITVAAGTSCKGGLNTASPWGDSIQCVMGAPVTTTYVNTYPPTCTATYNGLTGTSTATGTSVYTCSTSVAPAKSAPINVGASGTCNPGLPNVFCAAGAATTTAVNTYPPTCAVTVPVAGVLNADASGNVVVACPVMAAGTWSAGTNVAAGGSCDATQPNVQCTTAAPTTTLVTSYPPTCAVTYNGAAGTTLVPASGTVITACPTTAFTTVASLAAGATCNATLPNVNCTTTAPTTALVTSYPPTCAINYNGATGSTTVPAGGTVVTACPNAGATFSTWTNSLPADNCVAGPTGSGGTVNCQYNWGAWTTVSTAGTYTTTFDVGPTYTIHTGLDYKYTDTINGNASGWSNWANYAATSCTPLAQNVGSPYSVILARNCQVINVTTPTANTPANPAAAWVALSPGTCAASPAAGPAGAIPISGPFVGGQNVQCRTVTTGPTAVATCNPIAATSGNGWIATSCVTDTILLGGLPQYNSTPVGSCAAGSTGVPNYVVTTCPAPITTGPTNTSNCIPDPATAANNWITTACSGVSGGTFDTLADVAEYYYISDLRTVALGNNLSAAPGYVGIDISNNNVPPSGLDSATHQHMTTFTLGLGARGRMVFDPNYQTALTGDYFAVKQGSTANTTTGVCSWQASNTICDWPIPKSNAIENVDDLWHAAVNGRGTYFSATNPADLAYGLSSALAGVSARRGSAAAATTSTAFITQGDNFMFHSSFMSLEWSGDLTRQQIDVTTGKVLPTIDWSAQAKLDLLATPSTTRNIYFFNTAGVNNLSQFLYANLNVTQQSYFDLVHVQMWAQGCVPLSAASCMSLANQNLATNGNLVNFLRGDNTNAGVMADNTKYYRQRLHNLGDIVNSESVYVKLSNASFTDPGYAAFQTSTAITTRKAMVYVGANDGMLHAFRAADDPATAAINEGGQEDWAYIPSFVMPNLYKLADKDYGSTSKPHQYFVDGSPVDGDICIANCANLVAPLPIWKTILVGGLNLGGKGFYALDITDPATPKALWEFTDVNMGYSFGNPKIVKLGDGTWVVLLTSGYNNADGQGHLYVLNAYTGTLIRDIATGVGTNASPSGLSRIDTYVNSPGIDATVKAVYAGDLLGNVWRFDINGADTQTPPRWPDIGAPGIDVQLLATLKDGLGNAQPVTSKPLLTLNGSTLMVIIGTGRYLGSSDLTDTSQQSFYGMKDTMGVPTAPATSIWGNPRTQGTFVQQLQAIGTCPPGAAASVCLPGSSVVLSTNRGVSATNGGWYFDFAHLGERVNTNPDIAFGTIVLGTNVPSSGSCTIGGESYVYFLNFLTGGTPGAALIPTSNLASNAANLPAGWGSETWGVSARKFGNETISNPNIIYMPDGTIMACFQGSSGGDPVCEKVIPPDFTPIDPRRISWRELIQ